jgi:hypothetical protein
MRFNSRRLLIHSVLLIVTLLVARNLRESGRIFSIDQREWNDAFFLPQVDSPTFEIATITASSPSLSRSKKGTIAYATTLTKCKGDSALFEGAAVVHQSIRLAHRQSNYDYHMIVFVHPDAQECASTMQHLGYEVQIRETPFNETEMLNNDLRDAQRNSCCGAKEYLKLYSYVQLDYPVVVHLDLDTVVLKPMDDVFDLMLDPLFDRSKISAMWLKPEEFPPRVDFLFTRDYNMVKPGKRQPHQIGVQGGLLIIRPNATDFQRFVDILLQGGDYEGSNWGGKKLGYGGYYGAGTIQGLASFYYGEFARNRSVELNRCYYDTMVDIPYNEEETMCTTLEPDLTCQDCRKTDLENIYIAHFTVCGKPGWCANPTDWWETEMVQSHRLCMELFREWHLVRLSLENEWKHKYQDYDPGHHTVIDASKSKTFNYYLNFTQGHCTGKGKKNYIALKRPTAFENSTSTSASRGSLARANSTRP